MEYIISFVNKSIDEKCSKDLLDLKQKYNKEKDYIKQSYEGNKLSIEDRIRGTWDELQEGYNEYVKNETKNTISIEGYYFYRDIEYDIIQIDYDEQYVERTLDHWIEYNNYEMDTINMFLRQLPLNIKYQLSLSSHDRNPRSQPNSYTYTGGEDLIITFTKLD